MKQPVWILNSSLLILFFMSQLLLFMLQKAVPRRVSINSDTLMVLETKAKEPVNIPVIYEERDLFGTYETPTSIATKIEDIVSPMPVAPKNIVANLPVEKAPTFFAPLDCILKGVIFVKDDPSGSLAIIQFKKTKEEENYQVGDLVEDAQILKILQNKVIVIRSNGQQETLYLREEDAIHDFESQATYMPKNVIESSLDNKYKINIDEFVKLVPNLGEFINVLNLTTVYHQGKSFGCRIGTINKDSLGNMLGFVTDDIMINIDNFAIDDLTSRINIYNHILNKTAGDIIKVDVLRDKNTVTLIYGLVDYHMKNVEFSKKEIHQQLTDKVITKKNKESGHDSVVIQSERASYENSSDILNNNQIEDAQFRDLTAQYFAEQKQNIPTQDISSSMTMPIINQQTLNEVDTHHKKLIQERDKLTPAVQNIKTQDRKNMLKQTNRNIIFNGMAQ